MTQPDFIYTTYIESTPEKVWQALTTPEFTRQYWGNEMVSDWKKGSTWDMKANKDGKINVTGIVKESAPPSRLVLSWAEKDKRDDESQVAFDIETANGLVKLTVTHTHLSEYMGPRISGGWPFVLASLKTFIETGKPFSNGKTSCGSSEAA